MKRDDGYHDRVARLCSRFGYPEPIRVALERTCRTLRQLQPRAILLVGSAARGELTFRPAGGGRLEMFSDLEMLCILGQDGGGSIAAAHREIARLQSELFVPNGLFHLDCSIVREVRGDTMGRGLLWYEGGRTFQVLYGQDEAYFGEVEASALSLELVNQLVIIRLWWLLIAFPSWLLTGEEARGRFAGAERDAFLYAQIRNLLDVLSIWLPNEGVYECGYRGRLDYLRRHVETLRGVEVLPEDFPDHVAEATRKKLECDLSGDPLEWYRRVVAGYEGLLGLILEVPWQRLAEGLPPAIEREWTQRCAAPRSWKFRVYSALLTARYAAAAGAGVHWLRERGEPEGAALSFLVEMHRAAVRRMDGANEAAVGHLAAARRALWRFSGDDVIFAGEQGLAAGWHALRSAFVPPFLAYFRQVRGQADAIGRRLQQDEEQLLA